MLKVLSYGPSPQKVENWVLLYLHARSAASPDTLSVKGECFSKSHSPGQRQDDIFFARLYSYYANHCRGRGPRQANYDLYQVLQRPQILASTSILEEGYSDHLSDRKNLTVRRWELVIREEYKCDWVAFRKSTIQLPNCVIHANFREISRL
jgi:hypothetical protein